MEVDEGVSEEDGETTSGSVEGLQRSLRALLERRGVMADLRAHLRSHLVALVRNVQTGEPLVGKDMVAHRLERKFQALNILITEYLIREEFNYTLSVFVSELPLPNMLFHYAKTLLEKTDQQESADFRFGEDDIWNVLNTLANNAATEVCVKRLYMDVFCKCLELCCDSEHAVRIFEAYQSNPRQPPLLLCILQSIHLYRTPEKLGGEKEINQGPKSANVAERFKTPCMHSALCEPCQDSKIVEKDDLARKKKHFIQDLSYYYALVQDSAAPELEPDTNVEKDHVDEMFEQLKSVYEAETAMLRSGQDKKLQQAFSSYQEQLASRERELEEEYTVKVGVREKEMEERKQFLWQLARRLRQQHSELTDAMHKVHLERRQLQMRELNLKEQLKNAEDVLKRNGEEMRDQLTQELKVLEQHMDAMKTERNNISYERKQLEKLKMSIPNQSDEVKTEFEEQKRKNADLQMHYDILRNELSIVQKYIAAAKLLEPKSLVESSSLTNICGVNNNFTIILNTESEEATNKALTSSMLIESKSSSSTINEIKDTPMNNSSNGKNMDKNQLINDLKKFKNVNFRSDAVVQVNSDALSAISEWLIAPDNKPGSERTDIVFQELLSRLREDNMVLRNFTVQQQEHIREMASEQARLRAELASAQHTIDNMTRLSSIAAPVRSPRLMPLRTAEHSLAHTTVWGKRTGGGETGVPSPTPRATKDSATFFKPVPRQNASNAADERRTNAQNSWRSLNHSGARFRTRPVAPRPIHTADSPNRNDASRRQESPTRLNIFASRINPDICENEETIINNTNYREQEPAVSRAGESIPLTSDEEGDASSANDMLASAKTRLRKLEIEAEVVEQSYLDFKRRHAAETSKSAYSSADGRIKEKLGYLASSHHSSQSVDFHVSSLRCKKNEPHSRNITYKYPSTIIPVNRRDELTKYLSDYKKLQNKIQCRPTLSYDHISYIGKTLHDVPNSTKRTEQDINHHSKDKGNIVEKPLTEFRKLYRGDNNIAAPTTHMHKALQELRSNQQKETKEKLHSPTRLVLRPKAKANVKEGQAPVSPLTRRQYYNSDDTPTRRLTEEQLEILRNNLRKRYSMKEAPREEKNGKFNIFSDKDPDTAKANVRIVNKDIESTEKGNINIDQDISQSQPVLIEQLVNDIQKTMNDFKKTIIRYEKGSTHDLKEVKISKLAEIVAKSIKTINKNHGSSILKQSEKTIQDDQETSVKDDQDTLVEGVREVIANIEEITAHDVREDIQEAISNDNKKIITLDVRETIASHVQEIMAQGVQKIMTIDFQEIISDDVKTQHYTVKDVQGTIAQSNQDNIVQVAQKTVDKSFQESTTQYVKEIVVDAFQDTTAKNVHEIITNDSLKPIDIIGKDFQETKGNNISDFDKQVFPSFEKDITKPGTAAVPALEVKEEYVNVDFSAYSDGKSDDSPISFAKSDKDDSFWN